MGKTKILVVGSLVMDLIVTAPRFVQAGETILGTDYRVASGGKGANQAVQAARMGAQVTMVGKVGADDFGRQMVESLRASGVDVSRIAVTGETASAVGNVQICAHEQGTQNRIVVVPGANMAITPGDVAFLQQEIDRYDMVLLQLEIPMEINEQVARYAKAKGVPVMLNPAPSARLSPQLLSGLTYLSPNEHEAADLVGFAVTDEQSAARAVRELLKTGVANVLITRGSNGVTFGNANGVCESPSVRCERVADPTAAGDSFIGAFAVAVCEGLAVEDALAMANHAASLTVSRMGAQPSLPNRDEVQAYIQSRRGPQPQRTAAQA